MFTFRRAFRVDVRSAFFYEYGGKLLSGTGMDHPQIAPYGTYQTADGPIFIVIQNPGNGCNFVKKGLDFRNLLRIPDFQQT